MSNPLYTYDPTKLQVVSGVIELILPNTLGTLLFNDIYNMNSWTSFSAVESMSGSDGIGWQVYLNGALKYYNGSSWVSSDGTYSQSTTNTVLAANVGSLVTSAPSTVQLQAVFSGSGSTTPQLSSVNVSYANGGPIVTPVPGSCNVYVYLQDIIGNELTLAENSPDLIAVNDVHFVNNDSFVARFYKSVEFFQDIAGICAVIPLVITSTTGNKIRFMITYLPDGDESRVETIRLLPCVIPNQNSADLTTLTLVDGSQII